MLCPSDPATSRACVKELDWGWMGSWDWEKEGNGKKKKGMETELEKAKLRRAPGGDAWCLL